MRIVSGLCGPSSAGTQRKRRQGEAGTFVGVRCGTQARQAVWRAMCVRITAMVQGSHGMVAQARRHLDPCVSVLREHVLRTRVEHMRTARHRGESIERRECWLA